MCLCDIVGWTWQKLLLDLLGKQKVRFCMMVVHLVYFHRFHSISRPQWRETSETECYHWNVCTKVKEYVSACLAVSPSLANMVMWICSWRSGIWFLNNNSFSFFFQTDNPQVSWMWITCFSLKSTVPCLLTLWLWDDYIGEIECVTEAPHCKYLCVHLLLTIFSGLKY